MLADYIQSNKFVLNGPIANQHSFNPTAVSQPSSSLSFDSV